MKHLFTGAILFFSLLIKGQSFTGQVVDGATGEALPFVNITINGTKKGTASDIDGRFILPYSLESVQFLEFSFIGYQKLKDTIIKGEKVYELTQISEALQEVTVLPGVNPAHRIIKNAVANKNKNRPKSLNSFAYISYSKLIVGLNVDSVEARVDTITKTVGDSIVYLLDSSNLENIELANKQYLFLTETVTKRQFLAPSRDNETVLAQHTSGFKNPLFSLITTQLQGFSFYDDYFTIIGEDFLNPLTKGSTSKYIFIIEDTTYNELDDTVFTIRFLPKPNYAFRPLEGRISLNSKNWAVQNVIATPVWEDDENGLNFTIKQNYKKFGTRTWFPVQLSAEANFKRQKDKTLPAAIVNTYIKDVQINPELKRSKISLAEITIDELAVQNADQLLEQYRNDSLSEKEKATYQIIDSIGEAENLDGQIQIFSAIFSGKIPLYVVDIELDQIVNFNEYEGFRLGIGAHTNSRFSRWFTGGGYFAYGFRDKVWKYGYDASVTLNKIYNLKLYGGYLFDLTETGGVNKFLAEEPSLLIADSYRSLFVQQFDQNSQAYGGITLDPIPTLNTKLEYRRQNLFTLGNYRYRSNKDNVAVQNGFTFHEVALGLRYSPNEKVLEAAEYGRISLNEASPVMYVNVAKSIPSLNGDNFDYTKAEVKISYFKKNLSYGRSIFEVQGGKVWGAVPFSKLYAGESNGIITTDFIDRAGAIADRSSFETMRFNEFLNSAYVHVMFRQDFRATLFKRGDFAPHIEVVTRGMWGILENSEEHLNTSTQDVRKGYYESGLELNKLVKFNFIAIGIGGYYRYGPYSLPETLDNLTVKLTSKFSF